MSLRRTLVRRGGGGGPPSNPGEGNNMHGAWVGHGIPNKYLYPMGVPKRQGPMYEQPMHPGLAPSPGGFFMAKHAIGVPFTFISHFDHWRFAVALTLFIIVLDVYYGVPVPFMKEQNPRMPKHNFHHNNCGVPHHFWCYQDGWNLPNHSGVKRMVE